MRLKISGRAVVCVFASATPAAAQTPKELPPDPGPLRSFSVPAIQTATLTNGIRIALIERHSLPIVTGRIQIDAGAVRESPDKNGIAVLTAALLSEGTRDMTAADIADKMAELGAQFGTGGGVASANATVTSLKNVFGQAFAIAAKTVMEPRFDPTDFNRVRATSIASFEQSMASGSAVASRVFARAVYDSATPYSRLSGGTKTSLESLTRDDVVAWHRAMYSPWTTTVLLVGDITLPEARALIEKSLGSWNAPKPALAPLANKLRAVSATRIILVDRPGSVQTSITAGQGTLGWGTSDFFPIQATAQILGGGFGSRVNMNLREKHGWSYGAFANFNPLAGVGTFAVNSEVRTNATDSAIAEVIREYKRIASEAVPAEEARDQLNNVVASFPSSVQTVQGLMGRLANVVTYGLPGDFYTTYRERLAAVTPADISRVGRERLTPSAITIVAVGDLKSIEAPVRALNLGTVEVWTADGSRIR